MKAPKLTPPKRHLDLSVRRRQQIEREVAAQRAWMDRCGGSRAGYIAGYGSRHDAEHSGDGGEAIWDADYAHLASLLAMLEGSPAQR